MKKKTGEQKMKQKNKIISLLLAICLVIGLMPTAAFATGADTGKAIQLVDSGTAANIKGGQGSNIYFGTYQQSKNGSGYNSDPIKWRALSNANGELFLLSDQNLDVFLYHVDSEGVTWEKSTMRSWLNGYGAKENTGGNSGKDYTNDNFIDTAFSDKEQGVIADTSVVNKDNPEYRTEGGNNTTDKIFLLSIDEANNSNYFANDNSRKGTNTAYVAGGGKIGGFVSGVGTANDWWLRSPGYNAYYAAQVNINGGVYPYGDKVHHKYTAVRPAFNLNLTSVLFTSAAVGGKAGDAIFKIGDYDGKDWKLTLLDNNRKFDVTEEKASGKPGDTITLNYTGATTGTNEYISVIIADKNGAQYYGRVAQPSAADGQVKIKIPASLADGSYTLNVFSEQYNGGKNDDTKLTDYASKFETVALTVSSDTTKPTLTSGGATRDSETAATVKFSSSEAGEYYYAVVDSGADKPTIDTDKAGTSCNTSEQTISLTSLSDAGAKDIYIVAKDAAGNVSDKLKISIPAYVAPSYGISASPAALNFGSKTVGYTEAPAAQTVTLTNTGNQDVTVTLPTSEKYTITAGEGFTGNSATLAANDGKATFTVQPNTGLGVKDYAETLTISGSNSASAQVALSFSVVEATYTLTVDLNGGSGSTTGGAYAEGAVINIDAGSRSHYRFDGWTSSKGGSFADASSANTTFTMPAADTTITANWRYIGGSGSSTDYYRLTFETNGGSAIDSIKKTYGTTIDLRDYTPTREGYDFNGWYSDKDLTDKIISIRLTGNKTVYAKWTKQGLNPGTGFENPFTDVHKTDWFYDDVLFVYNKKIMTGTTATTFSPYGTTTRGMMATVLWRMEGSPKVTGSSPYNDVESDKYYTNAVIWATQNGIFKGFEDNTFRADEKITREQLAAIFYRYAEYKGYDLTQRGSLDKFTDGDKVSDWAKDTVARAVGYGLIEGKDNNVLDPQGKATRAEFAAILHRFCERNELGKKA